MGLSACFGPFQSKQAFEERVLGYATEIAPAHPRNWWGIAESNWFKSHGLEHQPVPGFLSRLVGIRTRQVSDSTQGTGRDATAAVADAQGSRRRYRRRAVGFAPGDAHWCARRHRARFEHDEFPPPLVNGRRIADLERVATASSLPARDLTRWTDELRRSAGPALTANRTMGSLGGLIASRIAREFKIGGPSFTVSCDETSGVQALAIAAEWLRRGELDALIVGAVDFAGDARAVISRHQLDADRNRSEGISASSKSSDRNAPTACDGAVALVVKRLADAERDGDKIYAIIADVTTGAKGGIQTIVATIDGNSPRPARSRPSKVTWGKREQPWVLHRSPRRPCAFIGGSCLAKARSSGHGFGCGIARKARGELA